MPERPPIETKDLDHYGEQLRRCYRARPDKEDTAR